MCILALAVDALPELPLICIHNRDEELSRPTAAPTPLGSDGTEDGKLPPVICGRDLLSGGTWMGLNTANGAFCALTNVRHIQSRAAAAGTALTSRGVLVQHFLDRPRPLEDGSVLAFDHAFDGFNLLTADLFAPVPVVNFVTNRPPAASLPAAATAAVATPIALVAVPKRQPAAAAAAASVTESSAVVAGGKRKADAVADPVSAAATAAVDADKKLKTSAHADAASTAPAAPVAVAVPVGAPSPAPPSAASRFDAAAAVAPANHPLRKLWTDSLRRAYVTRLGAPPNNNPPSRHAVGAAASAAVKSTTTAADADAAGAAADVCVHAFSNSHCDDFSWPKVARLRRGVQTALHALAAEQRTAATPLSEAALVDRVVALLSALLTDTTDLTLPPHSTSHPLPDLSFSFLTPEQERNCQRAVFVIDEAAGLQPNGGDGKRVDGTRAQTLVLRARTRVYYYYRVTDAYPTLGDWIRFVVPIPSPPPPPPPPPPPAPAAPAADAAPTAAAPVAGPAATAAAAAAAK